MQERLLQMVLQQPRALFTCLFTLLHAGIRLISRALRLRRTARVARPDLDFTGHAFCVAVMVCAARHAAGDIADFPDVFLAHRNASFRGTLRARS